MQIKRFEAKNMTAALRLIKAELGTDAVILSARSIKKRSGIMGTRKYSGVEVTAATDSHLDTGDPLDGDLGADALHPGAEPYSDNMQTTITKRPQAPGGAAAALKTYRAKRPDLNAAGKKHLLGLYQQLTSQGVDADIAADLTEGLKLIPNATQRLANGEAQALITSLLEPMGLVTQPIQCDKIKPQPIVFIGASGVGKTTTVAKLAAHFAIAANRAVALISFDDIRIGALEQIRTYARIIGVPLEVASNHAELKKHLRRFKDKDLVLIDTPGLNPNNRVQVKELQRHFGKLPLLQTQLVLSATTKETDLIKTINRLEGFDQRRLLFTRLDETGAVGNLLNILVQSHLPLSYVSDGQKIPDDIRPASLKRLVRILMHEKTAPHLQNDVGPCSDSGSGMDGSTDPVSHSRQANFVANRNSDVYHAAGCKWTQKIKRENIIMFESAAAATQRNYLPCRNCNPDRKAHPDKRVFERDEFTTLNVFAY